MPGITHFDIQQNYFYSFTLTCYCGLQKVSEQEFYRQEELQEAVKNLLKGVGNYGY